MKKGLLLLIIAQMVVCTAKAQLGYNYHEYSLGFGVGYEHASTDVPNQSSYPALKLNASYNFTPYVNFTLEYQTGKFSGGINDYYNSTAKSLDPNSANYVTDLLKFYSDYAAIDPYLRTYTNNYQSIMLQADIQVGEFTDLADDKWTRVLKNVYFGSGIGMIYNKISENNRYNADSTYVYGGADVSNNIVIPLRVGYQFKLYNAYDEPSVLINVGYQYNFVFGYGLDGYADPILVTKSFQNYGGFNIGVRFNFGNVTSYRKPLH